MTLEITKPSEQSFKSMLKPINRGGVVLFFTEPVGRQEYDNTIFMQRHRLIPTPAEQVKLYDVWKKKGAHLPDELIEGLKTWRGFILPTSHKDAAQFIIWLYTIHVLSNMIEHHKALASPEVAWSGVQQFWDMVKEAIN
jgi:hypothetical protein